MRTYKEIITERQERQERLDITRQSIIYLKKFLAEAPREARNYLELEALQTKGIAQLNTVQLLNWILEE